MTQRKLTDDEMGDVMIARCTLRKIRMPLNKPQCIDHALIHLDCVALHGTTDGQPYVDPEPPIPGGYRLAVAGDEGRIDGKYWAESSKKWLPAMCMPHRADLVFIVPADRTPTDEEAKSRPEVMVRDGSEPWQKAVLYGVLTDNAYSFLVVSQGTSGRFKYARHLYPGE